MPPPIKEISRAYEAKLQQMTAQELKAEWDAQTDANKRWKLKLLFEEARSRGLPEETVSRHRTWHDVLLEGVKLG